MAAPAAGIRIGPQGRTQARYKEPRPRLSAPRDDHVSAAGSPGLGLEKQGPTAGIPDLGYRPQKSHTAPLQGTQTTAFGPEG